MRKMKLPRDGLVDAAAAPRRCWRRAARRSIAALERRRYFLDEFIGDRVALNNLSVKCFGRQTDRKRHISIGSIEIRD